MNRAFAILGALGMVISTVGCVADTVESEEVSIEVEAPEKGEQGVSDCLYSFCGRICKRAGWNSDICKECYDTYYQLCVQPPY